MVEPVLITDRLADLRAAHAVHDPGYAALRGPWTKARQQQSRLRQRRKRLSRDAVRRLRDAGWSQNKIAHAIGVTQARVSQVERGDDAFGMDTLLKLAPLADQHGARKENAA